MKRTACYLILISVTGLIAYANTFHVPFAFDDVYQIENSPLIKGVDTFILSKKEHFAYNARRYIGYVTFALNYQFGKLDVTGYHVVNLSIHLINAVLVYYLLLLTFRTPFFSKKLSAISHQPSAGESKQYAERETQKPVQGLLFTTRYSQFIALFAALLFVSHPVQTQAVTYIAQRFTSLAAMFYLLSMGFYIRGRLLNRQAGRLASHALALLSAGLAMMTKEIAFTLPVTVILYEFIFFKSPLRRRLFLMIPVVLTLVVIFVGVFGTHRPLGELLSDLSERTRVQTDISRWDYFLTQLKVITTYVRLLFLPVNQNVDYDYPIARSFFSPSVFLSFIFLASIFGTALYLLYKTHGTRSKGQRTQDKGPKAVSSESSACVDSSCFLLLTPYLRLIAFGILWFFITLSVESSFIPIADVIFEHRIYLPSVGAFTAIATSLFAIAGRLREGRETTERVVIVGLAAIVLIFSMATHTRNMVWQDEVRLWEDVVKKSPGNARAYNNLGYLLMGQGQSDKSAGYFARALQLQPEYTDARNNLGVAYYNLGYMDAAIEQFKTVQRLVLTGPYATDAHHNLGLAYIQKGMLDEAITEMEAALSLMPDSAELYNDLGVAYKKKGLLDKAINCFEQAVGLRPDYAGAHFNLGLIYKDKGMKESAEQHLRRAHDLDPSRF